MKHVTILLISVINYGICLGFPWQKCTFTNICLSAEVGEVVGTSADPGAQDYSLSLAVTTWWTSAQQPIWESETDRVVGSAVGLAYKPGDRFDKGESNEIMESRLPEMRTPLTGIFLCYGTLWSSKSSAILQKTNLEQTVQDGPGR